MSEQWQIWLVIAALVAATALTRSAFWLLGHHLHIPKRVQEALRYAPACALAAIIVPDLLLVNGSLVLANDKLIAALCALAFYLFRRDMLLTILLGMGIFTVLRLGLIF
jgi:branched-subunit amino acid transport protein